MVISIYTSMCKSVKKWPRYTCLLMPKMAKKRKHSTWVKKYISERADYGVCNTLLPELAANEVLKCIHYIRVDIDAFEELLSLVQPQIQRITTRMTALSDVVEDRRFK